MINGKHRSRHGTGCTGCRYCFCFILRNPCHRCNCKNCCQYQKRRTYTRCRNSPLRHTGHRSCCADAVCGHDSDADDCRDSVHRCLIICASGVHSPSGAHRSEERHHCIVSPHSFWPSCLIWWLRLRSVWYLHVSSSSNVWAKKPHVDSWVYVDDDTRRCWWTTEGTAIADPCLRNHRPLFFGAADAIEHIVVKRLYTLSGSSYAKCSALTVLLWTHYSIYKGVKNKRITLVFPACK